ncbi:Thermoresistant gluconokinase [Corynebacterium aquatimens]|nr:Thermoresistant gluconokinase [Corynebacterium aquatimens]
MGVSGCGKSTVGRVLADALGLPFIDGDDLHPAANIAKMARGTPLNDDDRVPWLHLIGQALARSTADDQADGVVVACSALKRSYRDIIRTHAPDAVFIHLDVPEDVLRTRLEQRTGHFMPPELLRSQLDTLEPLGPDEKSTTFDAIQSIPGLRETSHPDRSY